MCIRDSLEAYKYGAPPHAGMAFGFDRLVALLLGIEDIRDVIAFPKVQNASELMTKCPTPGDSEALAELGISTVSYTHLDVYKRQSAYGKYSPYMIV